MSLPILVIGGINMDILGIPDGAFRYRDSNIGRLQLAAGGVGHNIARQLALQGARVELMCAFGDDAFAGQLRHACAEEGIGTHYAMNLSGRSCSYLAIHDEGGDMAASINDMALMKRLDADAIRRLPRDGFAACVLDANLSTEALKAAAEHLLAPLIADPVSCAKGSRLIPVLPRLTALKPNLSEAEAMSDCSGPEAAASALLDTGLQQVYISLGREGLYYASREDHGYIRPTELIDAPATGAGDAMAAGLTLAMTKGFVPRDVALCGLREAERRLITNRSLLRQEEEP